MSQTLTQGKVMTTHETIVAAYENYLAENAKFSDKGVKASAARARKALQEIAKSVKVRRAEITTEKEALTPAK
jgi:ElaB/YqjD/DUF883 family membrane-anchored ribosome-binding protein